MCYFVVVPIDEGGTGREGHPRVSIPLIRNGKVVYGNPEQPRRGPRKGKGVPTAKVVRKVNRLRAEGMTVEDACLTVSGEEGWSRDAILRNYWGYYGSWRRKYWLRKYEKFDDERETRQEFSMLHRLDGRHLSTAQHFDIPFEDVSATIDHLRGRRHMTTEEAVEKVVQDAGWDHRLVDDLLWNLSPDRTSHALGQEEPSPHGLFSRNAPPRTAVPLLDEQQFEERSHELTALVVREFARLRAGRNSIASNSTEDSSVPLYDIAVVFQLLEREKGVPGHLACQLMATVLGVDPEGIRRDLTVVFRRDVTAVKPGKS